MIYPILEFDPAPEALIEPSKIIRARDLPEHCVICFFLEVIEKIIAEHDAKVMHGKEPLGRWSASHL